MDTRTEQPRFRVVVNEERQHSIWPAYRADPPGWQDGGFQGDEQQCAAHIAEVWLDIRPASLAEEPAELP